MEKAKPLSDAVYNGIVDEFFAENPEDATPGFAVLEIPEEPETGAASSSRQKGSCDAAAPLPGGSAASSSSGAEASPPAARKSGNPSGSLPVVAAKAPGTSTRKIIDYRDRNNPTYVARSPKRMPMLSLSSIAENSSSELVLPRRQDEYRPRPWWQMKLTLGWTDMSDHLRANMDRERGLTAGKVFTIGTGHLQGEVYTDGPDVG